MQPSDPLRELLSRYLTENLIDPRDGTRNKHEIAIRWLERVLGKEVTLADLTNTNLARMMNWLAANGRSRPTINGYRGKLVALWAWACKQGWLAVWPSTKKMKEPKRSPTAWSAKEIGILWQSLDDIPGYVAGVPAPLWWKAYHLVAWDSGERHTARMSLTWKHFTDFDAGQGIFPAEIRKGCSADLPFSLHPLTMTLLREIRGLGAGKPHPWVLYPLYFWQVYGAVLRRAGLPDDRAHKTHCLRRSFATHLVAMGAGRSQVSGHLGQSDPNVIDLYLDGRFIPTQVPHQLLFRPWEIPGDDGPPRAA